MSTFAKQFLFLTTLSILVVAFVPFSTPNYAFGNLGDLNVDVAYQLTMPFFLEQNFQFGDQVIFTYGPWAILHTAIAPIRWFPLIIIFRIMLVLGILLASIQIVRGCRNTVLQYIALGGFIGLWLLWFFGPIESFYMFPSLMVAYFHLHRQSADSQASGTFSKFSSKYIWILLTILSGWLSLVKFSYFVVAGLAFFLILISNLVERKLPILPAIYLISLVVLWLSAGQDLANLPYWISLSLNLSGGYSDAMSKGFLNPYSISQVAAYYIIFIIISSLAFYHTFSQRWNLNSFLSFLLTLFTGFLSVRYAFGGNQIENSLVLLFMLLWFVVLSHFRTELSASRGKIHTSPTLIISASLIACVLLNWLFGNVNFPFYSLPVRLSILRNNTVQLISWVKMQPTDYYSMALARSHDLWPTELKFSGQTIDVYPQHTGVVIGREGLQYSPRPAFLSLNAHTRDLALLNKKHLEGGESPDLIAFQVLPQEISVHNRYPAMADGPSWPLLISKYEIKDDNDSNLLLLGRRAVPKSVIYTPILDDSFLLSESIDMPAASGSILWAEIKIERSFLGNLFKTFYKSPHINIECVTVDGTKHLFQVVPELGNAGFILSPLVKNNDEFSQLFIDKQNYDNAIREITVQPELGLSFLWSRFFKLKIDLLEIR